VPRESVTTGSTFASRASEASAPPAKSTTKRREKCVRLPPTWPPMPLHVIAVVASGGVAGIFEPQYRRYA